VNGGCPEIGREAIYRSGYSVLTENAALEVNLHSAASLATGLDHAMV
jgi:hypothetical protein